MTNELYSAPTGDAYRNIARDEWFLSRVGDDGLILYFYINDNAVIIGKNQNPWRECALDAMKRDGVQLVRRRSGGGAVWHDRGNLNFSFIAGQNRYDKEKQHRLILEAVRSLGIPCEFSGRNDLLAGGKKFSGNAYCTVGTKHLHHGTLLVSSDLSGVARYLTPDPRKMSAKGVSSVRSRVTTLAGFIPGLTVDDVKSAVIAAFEKRYGALDLLSGDLENDRDFARLTAEMRSDERVYGHTPAFDAEIDLRCSFGGVQILLSVKEGVVSFVKTYTDANDVLLPSRISALLTGVRYDDSALGAALRAEGKDDTGEIARAIADRKSVN